MRGLHVILACLLLQTGCSRAGGGSSSVGGGSPQAATPAPGTPPSSPITLAAPANDLTLIRTMTGPQAWPWERVECYDDSDPNFVQEDFLPDYADFSDNDVLAFGGDETPHSRFFLFHYGTGWQQATQPVPVLLVPGAIRSASVILHDSEGDGTEGLAPDLIRRGYAVFSLSWAYPSGENFMQAEHIANALRLVAQATGQPRADVVAASKGGVPARIYVTQMNAGWRTPYRDDVRRLVLVGAPNDGLDGMFRHPAYAAAIDRLLPWDRRLTWSGWVDTFDRSIYNAGRFMGHLQLLRRWDGVYPVQWWEPDAWTSYYGGQGLTIRSRGIDEAIALGGDLIARLNQAGVAPDVEIAVLAGTKPFDGSGLFEYEGPGDMAVFTDSALYTGGMTQNGAPVIRASSMFYNHGELLYESEPLDWIDSVLRQ